MDDPITDVFYYFTVGTPTRKLSKKENLLKLGTEYFVSFSMYMIQKQYPLKNRNQIQIRHMLHT